jgi:hypothetical protein
MIARANDIGAGATRDSYDCRLTNDEEKEKASIVRRSHVRVGKPAHDFRWRCPFRFATAGD